MVQYLKRVLAQFLILCIAGIGFPLPASAGMISTERVVADAEREQLKTFLDRADVRAQLEAHGVSSEQARNRVDALSDEEAKQFAGRMAELPAGGDGLVGALIFIFVLLLVTDLLGLTKVFPFTRSQR